MKTKEEWAKRIERILQAGDYPKLGWWIEAIQRDALEAAAKHCEDEASVYAGHLPMLEICLRGRAMLIREMKPKHQEAQG